jgi:hypothetical protein
LIAKSTNPRLPFPAVSLIASFWLFWGFRVMMRQLLRWELALFMPFRGKLPASVSPTFRVDGPDELAHSATSRKASPLRASREIGVAGNCAPEFLGDRCAKNEHQTYEVRGCESDDMRA